MGTPFPIEYRMLVKDLTAMDEHGLRKFVYRLHPDVRTWLKQHGIRATFKPNPMDARILARRIYMEDTDEGTGTLWFPTSYQAILFKMNINIWDDLK